MCGAPSFFVLSTIYNRIIMSYPPTPPPVPQQAPIPVQPLGYVPPAPTYTRPGIITAVAVISIIVASLSLLFSAGSALYGFGMAVASGVSRTSSTSTTTVATTTPPPAAGQATSAGEDVDEDGMAKADRKTVVDAFASLHPLTDIRQKHLDALLELYGKKVLPLSGAALTPQAVRANVTDVGRFPSGTGKRSAGSDYFAVALGRFEIDDRHAVFYPVGAGDVLRASAVSDDAGSSEDADTTDDSTAAHSAAPAPPPGTFGSPLTEKEVRQVIATIETNTGHKLNAAQAKALRGQLKTPGQMIFMPATTAGALSAQVTASTWSNGTFVLITPTSSLTLPATGGVSLSSGFGPGGSPFPNVMTQAVVALICAGLSLLLAIFLLIAGIMATRNSPRARKLHLIYAYLKLPIGIADVAAGAWLWHSMFSKFPGAGLSPTWSIATIVSIPALLGLLYPVALLIVMHTRTVKAYYSPVISH